MGKKFIGKRSPTYKGSFQRSNGTNHSDYEPSIQYTLEESLEIFINAKIAEGVRPRTIQDYKQHIKYLKQFLGKRFEFKYINDLDANIIRAYITYLRDEKKSYEGVKGREKDCGLSINTINMRLRTLRTMCRFWYLEGMIASNPMENIKSIRQDQEEEVKGFSDEEIHKILNSFNERNYAEWRDKILILLLLDTGLRINEAISLTIDKIDFKVFSLSIPSSNAKNRKGREVPISREVLKKVRKLHEESVEYFGPHKGIFMNAYGEPLKADAVRRRFHRLGKRLGIQKLHPHRFRHTFIRNYILNGGDIFTLQKIVDHSDIKTTRKYIQMEEGHIKEQHNKFSPVRRYLSKNKYLN
ncbi:tyrosine-type recombinase/integrase [Priestia endophytica]|uniref:tyrosine-type recombinase/integrase n=1 Tax=Priestia endophytica TaxID=135735 RepID=UPI002280681F|nr:tyrosine-type recombinase/integrase [Priestia endophytica]MCY8233700.1 tyrosine-type recombinase/integrase [Priestia endophytica]